MRHGGARTSLLKWALGSDPLNFIPLDALTPQNVQPLNLRGESQVPQFLNQQQPA